MINKREHISYSELKDWNTCPHLHKKTWIEKVAKFEGNEYTAFGTAIHDVCEKKLLKEDVDEAELFQIGFDKKLQELMEKNIEVNGTNVEQMRTAGPAILAEVDEALKDYFGEYEVFSSEEMLYVPIENFNINFKGFVDAVVKRGDTYHLYQAIYNITKRFSIKNRLNCHKPYRCKLLNTPHCP